MFVLDPSIGSFVLVARGVRIPESGKTYSVNEANRATFSAGFQRYLDWAHRAGYSSRYIGSMVADVHRTLLKGGVFLYPPTRRNPEGKLRLLYEANPDGDDRRTGRRNGGGAGRSRLGAGADPRRQTAKHSPADERGARLAARSRTRRATSAGPCLEALRDRASTTPGSSRRSTFVVLLMTAGIRATPGVLMVPLEAGIRVEPRGHLRARSRSTSRSSA